MNFFDSLVKASSFVALFAFIGVLSLTTVTLADTSAGHPKHEGVVAGAYTDVQPTATPTAVPTSTPTPTPAPVASPVHISIPSLEVDAAIEPVGVSANNTMEIPHNFFTVGWFDRGPKPGEKGTTAAILNGHFDTSAGDPAIFYHLVTLATGSDIVITTADGTQFTYAVENVSSYALDNFPTDIVYGTVDGAYLKLITCDGVWDANKRLYSKRLVVTGRLR